MKKTVIDAYLASVSPDQRALLEKLRATIRKIVPAAEECISYKIPAFRFEGMVIYKGTKSSLHFQKPLPVALVRKLLRARIAEKI
jgi:uncharacterized protein YdhG (YjbR/CyaY superfamily)